MVTFKLDHDSEKLLRALLVQAFATKSKPDMGEMPNKPTELRKRGDKEHIIIIPARASVRFYSVSGSSGRRPRSSQNSVIALKEGNSEESRITTDGKTIDVTIAPEKKKQQPSAARPRTTTGSRFPGIKNGSR